jgi:dGTPase
MRDHGGFEGNGQTLRISSRLEHFSDRHGYDFTRRATLGILKYPTAYGEVANSEIQPSLITRRTSVDIIDRTKSNPPKCYFETEHDVVNWALSETPDDDVKKFKEFVKVDGKHGKAVHKSLDASIMDIADDIAYGIHDLEDVIALRLISESDFRAKVKKDVCHPFLDFLRLRCGEADPYEHFILSLFGDSNERKRCISRLVGVMVNAVALITMNEFNDPILRYRVNMSE